MLNSVATVSEASRLTKALEDLSGAVVHYIESAASKVSGKEASEIQSTLRQARAVGEFTVLMTVNELKKKFDSGESTADSPVVVENTDVTHIEAIAPACVPDYDTLTATQILEVLPTLSPNDVASVIAYESATRARGRIVSYQAPTL